jgi:AraC-like DNA-binding protein
MTEPAKRMTPGDTIAAGFVRALMELAVSKGAERGELLRRAGLDPAALDDQDRRIPFARYIALIRAGKALTGDDALALHFGEAFDIADLSIVGLIGRASESLAEAFAQTNRYGRLMVDGGHDGDRFTLARDGEGLWMIDNRIEPDGGAEHVEANFARMVSTARRWFPGNRFLKAVHFRHAAPAWRDAYDRVLRIPVVFESDRNALLTDEAWMSRKTEQASRYVFGVFSARAQALLEDLERAATVRGQVERLLLPALHKGDIGADRIAARMGLSRRTLARRLKAEGTGFAQVLDALRHRMALHYLESRKVSVNETAYLVGFSESAAFSRAFKRWTGRNPSG